MKKYIEYLLVFLVGGDIYLITELLWRGKTHWSMGIAGGICFLFIYFLRKKCPDIHTLIRCMLGSLIICTVEFTTGFIVNILLGWDIWDYSGKWMNIYGQICPLYAFYWTIICIPGNLLSGIIENLVSEKVNE